MRTILRVAISLLISLHAAQVLALEVYLNTNAPANVSRGSELFDPQGWTDTAKAIDGIWFVAQGMTKPPEGVSITKARKDFVQRHKDLKWIVEVNQRAVESRADGKKYSIYEPKIMKEVGIKDFQVMSFFEDRPNSTLTAKDIEIERQAMEHMGAKDAPLIVNTRSYTKNQHLQKLVKGSSIAGFSFEMASKHINEGQILETEVSTAIREAVKHNKIIYLLINAETSKTYLQDVERLTTRLVRTCPQEMATPLVRIVLSNYNKSNATPFTPERDKSGKYANTTTGAALWLAETADKHGLRKRAVQATAPAK